MLLLVLSYLGGVLTIVSPCVLPVLPFVFSRADQPFLRAGLPMLLGMAITFAAVATLAAVGGGWAVQANQGGRYVALILVALFGLALVSRTFADRITRPLVALGARLSNSATAGQNSSGTLSSFVLGIATGLLWAPCAGPILGLVLTGAALHGANAQTSLLLLAYAAGAATSLALALLAGGRLFQIARKSLGAGEWIRRGLGVAVIAGAAAIALGLDTGWLTKISLGGTTAVEQALIDRFGHGSGAMMSSANASTNSLPAGQALSGLAGAVDGLNSPALTPATLQGKVVLVDFWTYSCINCLRTLPYVRAWAEKYRDHGLVVIGVHSPEFAFEKDVGNVRRAVRDFAVEYPVAIDNNFSVWRAFNNQYWPAHYLIDASGRIRDQHFGEGAYAETERAIQGLLAEAGAKDVPQGVVAPAATGAEAAADSASIGSPETYIGYARAANFISADDVVHDAAHAYALPAPPTLNSWGLNGNWTVEAEKAVLDAPGGGIVFRFRARDLHLVLGPQQDGKPVRFRVLIDGVAPGADHGVDTNAEGEGTVTEQRLYQLVRQAHGVADRTFEIRFLDANVQAFSFTFG